ncbi:MAG: hypothetical protein ACLGGX_12435, partial [Bdellovibrionia bacterium]
MSDDSVVCLPKQVAANVTAHFFDDCDVVRGQSYRAKVKAFDAAKNERVASNNNFEFFVTEVPTGFVIYGMLGGTADIIGDNDLNDTGTVTDPYAFVAEWEPASGIVSYDVTILNLNNSVKCPTISTSVARATFNNCRLDLNLQYKVRVIGIDSSGLQYPALNSPFNFTYKKGLYISGLEGVPSYYRGIPITSCGGATGATCDQANPYRVNVAFQEEQIVIDKNGVLEGIAYSSGTAGNGNGRLEIEADYIRLEAGGKISMSGKGFAADLGPGAGLSSVLSGTGGAYGGNGSFDGGGLQAKAYGSAKKPMDLGSGGGSASANLGGAGGGSLIVKVNQELRFNSGEIQSNGLRGQANAGGGSGGSIIVEAKKISGSGGQIRAAGGDLNSLGGAGSGGRVAILFEEISHTGGLIGLGMTALPGNAGAAAGTVFYQNTKPVGSGGDALGFLLSDTGSVPHTVGVETPIPLEDILEAPPRTSHLFDGIITRNNATFIVEAGKVYTLQSASNPPRLSYRLALAGDLLMPSGTSFEVASGGYLEWRKTDPIDDYSNITIASGGVLTHSPNGNLRDFYLNIQATNLNVFGSINVNGKGHARGFGIGSSTGTAGAGHGGLGGYFTDIAERGTSYGMIHDPDVLGSGSAVAAGGGQVRIQVANNFVLTGSISANGLDGCGGGAGGSIFIETLNLQGSSGSVSAQGGGSLTGNCGGGSGGRIALLYQNSTYTNGVTAINFVAAGGDAARDGAAGTVFYKDTAAPNADVYGNLLVKNLSREYREDTITPITPTNSTRYDSITTDSRGIVMVSSGFTAMSPYILPKDQISYRVISEGEFDLPATDDLEVVDGGYLELRKNTAYTFDKLTLAQNGVLTHTSNGSTKSHLIHFIVNDLDLKGTINVTARGYSIGNGPGASPSFMVGAGHGGFGGNGGDFGDDRSYLIEDYGGPHYDDLNIKSPSEFGSGSLDFNGAAGAAGGGYVRFDVGNDFNFQGQIIADGGNGNCLTNAGGTFCTSGASGGGIFITTKNIKGAGGTLSANGGVAGGQGNSFTTGAGGGGRIALVYEDDSLYAEGTVRKLINYEKIRSFGGVGYNQKAGGAGSIFMRKTAGIGANTHGDFYYANSANPHVQKAETPFPLVTYDSIKTLGKATLVMRVNPHAPAVTYNVPSTLNYRLVIESNEVLPTNLTITNGGFLEWRKSESNPISLNNLTLENGAILTHSYNYGAADYQLNVALSGDFDLKGGSA